jgi:Protein of unknown function (DUF1353)
MAMLRVKLFALLLLGASAAVCQAASFGKYLGTVQTEWIESDRKMRLLAPFTYVDPKGTEWKAPAGWVIDGASIPVFAWSIIGGPYNGKYRNASVIHDVACDQKTHPWETVHEAFYWAMMASGVEPWRAKVMYAAVYHFGPRWPELVTVSVPQSETAKAPQQALAHAEPGSAATIIRVRPQAAPGANGAVQQVVDVQIQPPPRQLQEKDFEVLKERIMQKEGGSVSAPPPPAAERAPAPAARSRGFGGAGGGGGSATSDGHNFGYSAAKRGGGGSPVDLLDEGVSLSDIRSFKAQ